MGARAARGHSTGDTAMSAAAGAGAGARAGEGAGAAGAGAIAPGGASEIVFPPRDGYHAAVATYKEGGFDMLSDVTAVDYLTHPGRTLPDGVAPERFEVVANLLSLREARRVRVRVQVPDDDAVIATLWDL